MSGEQLQAELQALESRYTELAARQLKLDLTRGKPSAAQVALSDALDGILGGNYRAADGTDVRNYGGLDGLPEAKQLFAGMLEMPADAILIGGNSSLTLMYAVIDFALSFGLRGPESAWGNSDEVKFLCPVPGYDRHFAICEHLGIEMVPVPMLATGPDMDAVEKLVAADPAIKGMWCVPRFSNPTGCVYSRATVERLAQLGNIAGDDFVLMYDNAYAVHTLYPDAEPLASLYAACERHGTLDSVFQFGSTSKITFAGAGVAFMGSSPANLAAFKQHLGFQSIGPDKVNQLRHVRFLGDAEGLAALMGKHAELLRPRFEAVLEILEAELAGTGMGEWLSPRGGYFISFNTRPGLAKTVVKLAADVGVALTPAGATFPYGNDPEDSNIRLAPSFPSLEDVQATAEVFALCVKLASVRQRLAGN
ncbi:aminotransferase class I/II-fold pyridoxal phosphate-dependent enzyme [Mangrovimicrobium sediminis]|uniref:Aminotransferase class I/II-fold pyridoxal phosphate-dependent enzyme n=2 Tax=Mangrovimicrobium sediminis TaxID=2562682 RepID=A0A4Z0M428_9GAMM|nr:aminotransferase class I/II-fold pyridoxal phosphate-dependent enzyme [Haliea sp. SAOS-164]TGD74382.1 aminotransferase class I/II-fold pyridoxal phosphate-dependent enzyme [Haliea sp. SAOS-164]